MPCLCTPPALVCLLPVLEATWDFKPAICLERSVTGAFVPAFPWTVASTLHLYLFFPNTWVAFCLEHTTLRLSVSLFVAFSLPHASVFSLPPDFLWNLAFFFLLRCQFADWSSSSLGSSVWFIILVLRSLYGPGSVFPAVLRFPPLPYPACSSALFLLPVWTLPVLFIALTYRFLSLDSWVLVSELGLGSSSFCALSFIYMPL